MGGWVGFGGGPLRAGLGESEGMEGEAPGGAEVAGELRVEREPGARGEDLETREEREGEDRDMKMGGTEEGEGRAEDSEPSAGREEDTEMAATGEEEGAREVVERREVTAVLEGGETAVGSEVVEGRREEGEERETGSMEMGVGAQDNERGERVAGAEERNGEGERNEGPEEGERENRIPGTEERDGEGEPGEGNGEKSAPHTSTSKSCLHVPTGRPVVSTSSTKVNYFVARLLELWEGTDNKVGGWVCMCLRVYACVCVVSLIISKT